MSMDDPLRKIPSEPDPADEIEILEVVGLDEDGLPLDAGEADEDGDDVEVVFDESAPPVSDASTDAEAPQAREEAVLRDRLVRLQADFENFKKRTERERADHLRHVTAGLVGRLLPVLDNFERAIASARPETGADPIVDGIVLVQRQLLEELRQEGLRPMDCLGATFDPTLHDAVATDPDATVPAQTVTHVFQRGYFLHDRVLRPALVRVRVDGSEGAEGAGEEKES